MTGRGRSLKVNYPHVIADTDRHGNLRVYYRRKGRPKVRLFETPGTPEFLLELEEARKKAEGAAPAVDSEASPGSFRQLTIDYFDSAAFRILDPITQKRRRGIIEEICRSTLKNGTPRARLPYARIEVVHVEAMRDEKLDAPSGADGRIKALRQLFKWAVKTRRMKTNPAVDVEYVSGSSDGHHTWTVAEVEQYWKRHPIGTMARLAIDVLLFTGTRRSDAVRLGPPMSRDGALHFTEWKGSRSRVRRQGEGPKARELKILPALQESIDATPCGLFTYLVTSFGKPFTSNGFGNRMKKWCRAAGLPDHCTAHGLRKAGATIAAEKGATEHQLMAIFGWASPKQAATYTKKANRTRLAKGAMHLLMPDQNEPGEKVSHRKSGTVSHLTVKVGKSKT